MRELVAHYVRNKFTRTTMAGVLAVAAVACADDGPQRADIAVWATEHLGVAGMCIAKVLIGVAVMWRLAATAERGHRVAWLSRGLLLRKRLVHEEHRRRSCTPRSAP